MTQAQPPFYTLHFGHLDASQEALEEPDLLVEGYYDYREPVYGIVARNVWLLLGPKGSGKSTVLEHLRLVSEQRFDRFFTYWSLANFPVNDVTKIGMGQSGGGSRNQAAWEFLLLLRVVQSLCDDESATYPAAFATMVKRLKEAGLLVGDWLSSVAKWSGTKLKFDAKLFGAETQFTANTVTPLEISAYIREVLSTVETSNLHILALDGLDSFFFEAPDEWASLAGLMQAIYSLNREFRRIDIPASIVAAVRSDIFDVLPGAEMNKLKPHAVYLDWHAKGIGAQNHLWKLLTAKASVRHKEVTNLVRQYLGTRIAIYPHTELPEYLLDHTRLLPRDVVALMQHLQKSYRGDRSVTEQSAKNAVQAYCEEYFVGEIFDNLAGVLPAAKARSISSFKDALRTAPSRFFDFTFVVEELDGELEKSEVKLLLKQMFETGGIGIRNGSYTDFVFRKVSGAGFTTRYQFVLHYALMRAWNRRPR